MGNDNPTGLQKQRIQQCCAEKNGEKKRFFLFHSSGPNARSLLDAQSVKKVDVQEALPPAGVIGAESLTLGVSQYFPRKPA